LNYSKAQIFCDGVLPDAATLANRFFSDYLKIACDGAANHLLGFGFFPDIIIGDLDSFTPDAFPSLNPEQTTRIKDSDQETNDLEKALNFALTKGIKQVEIIGGLGKRIDHTLKNLSVLLQFSKSFVSIFFLDDWGISFFSNSQTKISAPEGTPISLIPFNGRVEGIITEGLEYSLKNEWLEMGKRDGTSNKMTDSNAMISKESGDLLLVLGVQVFSKEIKFEFSQSDSNLSFIISNLILR